MCVSLSKVSGISEETAEDGKGKPEARCICVASLAVISYGLASRLQSFLEPSLIGKSRSQSAASYRDGFAGGFASTAKRAASAGLFQAV